MGLEFQISAGSFNDQTQLLLVNAIHFKSPWETPFEKEDTSAEAFHLSSGDSILVDMMFAADRYSFGTLDRLNAQVVVIPYKASAVIIRNMPGCLTSMLIGFQFCHRAGNLACRFTFHVKLMDLTHLFTN